MLAHGTPTAAAAALLAACACASLLASPAAAQQYSQITTVQDLKAAIYTQMSFAPSGGGDACVRLLHVNGTAGCAAPGRGPAEGRLRRLDALLPSPDDYPDETVFLLPPALLAGFLQQAAASPALAQRTRGVLVEPQPPPGYSQAATAPLADFALYANRSYAWNPTGADLLSLALPFPVMLLDGATAAAAQQRAGYNADQGYKGANNWARMALHMDAAGNATACIAAQTCLPLGGHSVLATLPPLPAAGNGSGTSPAAAATGAAGGGGDGLPALWIVAQVDTAALFHEVMLGADAPVSSLIAMLAAANLLGSPNATAAVAAAGLRYRRRLVFAALSGEPWGLMGSKRLLWELGGGGGGNTSAALPGLAVANGSLAGVLEVTQVGRSRRPDGTIQLYTHTPSPGGGSSSDPQAALVAALQAAAANTSEARVSMTPAGAAAPGLPPTASAGSFVRVGGGGTPAVLLSGFDEAFQGSTFHTQYDTLDTLDTQAIAAAAVVLARAAHELALGGGGAAAAAALLPVSYANVQATVDALAQCLLNATVGLNCPLARAMMTPVNRGHINGYIGILRTLTADPQLPDPNVKSDVERFLWNFLAFATVPLEVNTSAPDGGAGLQRCQPMNATACPPGFVCAGSRASGPEAAGFCLNTTAAYVPSYSTSLLCDGCDGSATAGEFRWKLTTAATAWEQQYDWPQDPLWTESNWPTGTPALTLYLKEAAGTEWALLGAGLGVTAASVVAALWVRWAHLRKLKRQ